MSTTGTAFGHPLHPRAALLSFLASVSLQKLSYAAAALVVVTSLLSQHPQTEPIPRRAGRRSTARHTSAGTALPSAVLQRFHTAAPGAPLPSTLSSEHPWGVPQPRAADIWSRRGCRERCEAASTTRSLLLSPGVQVSSFLFLPPGRRAGAEHKLKHALWARCQLAAAQPEPRARGE